MRYTAVNIGPIIGTITMARKPRELWSASYLFSFLMECIIKKLEAKNKTILSPASLNEVQKVGLYPDRVFVEGMEDDEVEPILKYALEEFTDVTGIGRDYVNIMYVSIESETGKDVIKDLNRYLDCAELVNRPVDDKSRMDVLNLIQEKKNSALFERALGNPNWNFPFLAEIATDKLSKTGMVDKTLRWMKYRDEEREKENNSQTLENVEDEFYQKIKVDFKEEYYSYYKYICVVQADGDKMGKIVSSLPNNQVNTLSTALMQYGCTVSKIIEEYGGVPIYAGGDDLLFIAPVVSGKHDVENIFQLLYKIDECYRVVVNNGIDDLKNGGNIGCLKDKDRIPIHTTLSYGLSISYYKYPLYEALQSALDLLFGKAKKVKGKNAIAWCLRKHSGSGFTGVFSKNDTAGSVYQLFKLLMTFTVDDGLVSAISHKLRANEDLLNILRQANDENRIAAFYKEIMEEGDSGYIELTRRLFCELVNDCVGDEQVKIEDILSKMYGMLRVAKFINGEGDSDE